MDPISIFKKERKETLEAYAQDDSFHSLSSKWRSESMRKRYVYNFDWLGRPIIQYPQDMQAVQEVIWQTRPTLIIETGIAHGGSLIFSASMLAMLDISEAVEKGEVYDPKKSKRKVIGIDIDVRQHNRKAIQNHPMSNWIEMVEGSSISEEIVAKVKGLSFGHERVIVCLDSMHTHDHVLQELNAYAELVTKDCYCIVFDTFVEDVEDGFFEDRPWDVGNNPKTAVHEWLKSNQHFEIDKDLENKLMITVCPDGFLKRVR